MHHESLHKPLLKTIGKKLRQLRMASGDKGRTIAKAVGVTDSVVSKIENGEYPGLSLRLLSRFASYFSVSAAYFFAD